MSPDSAKLSSGDFRFLQAFVQGIDVRDAWARYMLHRGAGDLRRIRSTVRMQLDVLAAAAKRHGDIGTAVLFKRDPLRIKASMISSPDAMKSSLTGMTSSVSAMKSSPPPTLDEFAQTLEDPDFYNEAELADLWEQKYGKVAVGPPDAKSGTQRFRDTPENRAAKRRARLVLRQVDAIRRLESLVAASPNPQDPVAAWLDTESIKRLGSVGIHRMQELIDYINRNGFKWHKRVPRIGKDGAARLLQWLGHHEATLGRLEAFALVPVGTLDVATLTPRPQTGVVPFERFLVPSALSGFDGENRKPVTRCKIAAVNDYQAVGLWLQLYKPESYSDSDSDSTGRTRDSEKYSDSDSGTRGANNVTTGNQHTFAAYRKEAERFLLWAVLERGKPLSSLDAIDCAAYRRFLENPGPQWVAAKGMQRWSQHWRPFEGPLGPRSRAYAETVCKMLCRWLVGRNYLDSDPWDGAPKGGKKTPMRELRALSDGQLELLLAWLAGSPATKANRRLQLLFELALTTGLRKEELANAKLGGLAGRQEGQGEAGGSIAWTLQFYGKGGKERQVPLLEKTVARLFAHLEFNGILDDFIVNDDEIIDKWTDFIELNPETPMLARLDDPRKPLRPARIYELVKEALAACARSIEAEQPRVARQLKKASTHWLRHTLGRVWADRGGDLRVLGEILGHSNPATTAIYSRADEKRRRQEFNKVFG